MATITLTKPELIKYRLFFICLGLFALAVSNQAARALPYSFTTIDSPGAASTFLFKMNNLGQFVGAHLDPNLVSHSLLTDGRTFTVFDPPGSWRTTWPGMSAAQGINDSGQIVGYVEDTNNAHAYLKTGSTFSFFDHPKAGSGHPFRGTGFTGINDAGMIVGGYQDNNDEQGGFTLDANGMMTLFDHPNLPSGHQASASDINNLGQMVGSFFDVDSHGNPIQRGFFIDGSSLSFIDVPGSSSVFANGLNDLGDIVGAFYEDATGVFHGFVLSGGVLTVLDVPGGTGTLPGTFIHDIDNRGRLVGYYGEDLTRTPFTHPRHGFLATPVPEPPLPALLVIGLAVMSFARWRVSKCLFFKSKSMNTNFSNSTLAESLVLVAVIIGWPGTAGALLFEVQVGTKDEIGQLHVESVSSTILPVGKSSSQRWHELLGWGDAESEAVAAAGNVQLIPVLSARSFAHWVQSEHNGEIGKETSAFAHARFVYGGFIIDGPPGPVDVSVNFFIEGGIGAGHLGANMGVTSGVGFRGMINSDFGQSPNFILGDLSMCERGANTQYPCQTGGPHVFASGALFGVQVPGRFWAVAPSPTWRVTVGVPFEIGMDLTTSAFAFLGSSSQGSGGSQGNFATAVSDFFNTAGLWDGGPLFNLPQGYTAHSEDGLVVDNRLRLPGAPVPEPPMLALFLLGVAALTALTMGFRRLGSPFQ